MKNPYLVAAGRAGGLKTAKLHPRDSEYFSKLGKLPAGEGKYKGRPTWQRGIELHG